MIYEKKNVASSFFDESNTDSCASSSIHTKLKDYNLSQISKSKINQKPFFTSPRRKPRIPRIVVFAAVLLCVYAADSRFFNYSIKTSIETGIRIVTETAFGSSKNSSPSNSDIPERTLYTLSYSEPQATVKNERAVIPENAEDSSSNAAVLQDSVEASSVVSASSIDGVQYFPIVSTSLAPQNILSISNDTSFKINAQDYTNSTPACLENLSISEGPSVLILHTHACECYSEYSGSYPEDAPTRTENVDKNVVRVGKEIADILSEFGISSVHCDVLHDKDSFINAYVESADTVQTYLQRYPSIKFVIDVHRDAIIRSDGESVRTVTQIAGEDYAQLMFVVGTNELGHNHPDWKDNFSLAVNLQKSISDTYPGLLRSINLRNVPFNQQLSNGYLLLEVGTSANTLEEALRSARAFAQEFARMLSASARDL